MIQYENRSIIFYPKLGRAPKSNWKHCQRHPALEYNILYGLRHCVFQWNITDRLQCRIATRCEKKVKIHWVMCTFHCKLMNWNSACAMFNLYFREIERERAFNPYGMAWHGLLAFSVVEYVQCSMNKSLKCTQES